MTKTMVPVWIFLLCAYLFSHATAENKDQKVISADSGHNVTLPCQAPDKDIPILVVEWSRADLEDEYVLTYRDGQFDPDEQHPSFKNRVDLQDRWMKDGDVSLIVTNVTAVDAGTYECRVVQRRTNRRKRAHLKTDPISTITLSVVDPPGQTGGDTEDGGKEDGEKEDGGKEDVSVLKVGLSLSAVLLFAAIVSFLMYRKHGSKKHHHRIGCNELKHV
ncbi:programmed cell death 1 ligand 1-like [Simochromis diagramma]|uniref:programmed cell death 1 ligand 1-like n=1 Tax=Simochromis diagramma TaxID=43689 RepID=UPI001A7E43EA|nr:programmed cell death 1 ligand 1-like [Simochromis diagramma]